MGAHEPETFNPNDALRQIRDTFKHQVDAIVRQHPELEDQAASSLAEVDAHYEQLAAARSDDPVTWRSATQPPSLADFTKGSGRKHDA